MWQMLLLVMLMTSTTVTSELWSSSEQQRLVSVLDKFLECHQIPGLSMTVVKGKEHKTFAHGFSNRDTKEPVTTQTLFFMGAITQAFTATLLALLTQKYEGSILLDAPISQLIGQEFQLSNPLLTQAITIRDALMHRTGLATGSIAAMTGLPQAMSRSSVISNLKELPMQGGFRDDFRFNQLAFTLAAHVGEKITSSTWEKLMRVHLLDKLLMTSTTVAVDDWSSPDFSRSYVSVNSELVESDPKIFDVGPLAPASTMFTNAEDMVKGLKFFLGDPHLLTQVRLPVQLLEDLYMPRILPLGFREVLGKSSHTWPVPDINIGFGAGFFTNVYRGYQIPWSASFAHGFNSIVWLLPEKNMGIFIANNGQKYSEIPLATLQSLTYFVTDLLLGHEPWINETTICSFPEPWVKLPEFPDMDFTAGSSDFALADYTGTFSSPLLGSLAIHKSSTNTKALAFQMDDVTGDLLPEGGNVFRLFLDGAYKHLTSPVAGKKPRPFARVFFEFQGQKCIGLKLPDSLFGGVPVDFKKVQAKTEL